MNQYTIAEVEVLINSDVRQGLSSKEAAKRLKRDGPNELESVQKKSIVGVFYEQIKDPMVIILLVGALLSLFMQEVMDALIICLVVFLNAGIGSFQVIKSEKALEALKKMIQPTCKVRRDDGVKEIKTSEVVVGDLIEFAAGDCIPCDLRLTTTTRLMMDESLLTGESVPVSKNEFQVSSEKTELAKKSNMVFMSTYVSSGKGKGMAVGCGMNSEVGTIATLLQQDNEEMTPLQKRMNHMGKILGLFAIVICGCMFFVSMKQGKNVLEMLILAISLAVAAIPEGLPAVVTIVQSMGIHQMSKHHAIVRKLHAVETLGSVSVVCSDKTGTLTQNEMKVVSTYFDHQFDAPCSKLALQCMGCCHNVIQNQEQLLGDPSEKAIVAFVQNHIDVSQLACEWIRVDEIPFDSIRKRMSTIHQKLDHQIVFTKGSLEHLLPLCQTIRIHQEIRPFNQYERQRIVEAAAIMEDKALRVMAFATKQLIKGKEIENEMMFLGLVGLMDPLREEVNAAIQTCKRAKIRVVMITGDSAKTAYAIGKSCGLATSKQDVMSGEEIEAISDQELQAKLNKIQIFARVSPTHKVRLVKAFQQQGEIVAMSGDGVNDAPALKQANIGIAMGKQGSDVCKSVSDILLLDDNFTTIIHAIEAGRNIYLKIQKSVYYLLSCNLGEIMTLFLATVLLPTGVPALCAIQILWTNLVTDAFPALALGVEPDEIAVMQDPPRNPKESLFVHGGLLFILCNGCFIGTVSLVAFKHGKQVSDATAQTMAFMVLSLSQMFHALNCRQIHTSMFKIGFFKNHWLLLTVGCGIVLQVFVCHFPFFNFILKTVPLSYSQWMLVFLLSVSTIVINEISKLFGKR